MAKIIDFPKKRKIVSDIKIKTPTDVFGPLSISYIKIKEMSEKFPYILFKLPPGAKEEVELLIREYDELTFTLLKRIMVLEKELSAEREKK